MGLPTVVVTGNGLNFSHISKLEAVGAQVIQLVEDSPTTLERSLKTAEAVIHGGDSKITSEIIQVSKNLKLISFVGTGIASFVDCHAAEKAGVTLLKTAGIMAPTVAEHTVGLILLARRKLIEFNESAKDGRSRVFSYEALYDANIGIIGLGHLGQNLAKLLKGLGVKSICYWSRNRKHEFEQSLGLTYAPMSQVAATSDVICLCTAQTTETYGMINQNFLDACKPGTLLVNTASAELVNPESLRHALESGKIGCVVMDCYWKEPLPTVQEDTFGFLTLSNSKFVVTPHIAAKTRDVWPAMFDAAVENAAKFLRGMNA